MEGECDSARPPAIVIGGMHRSGTSLTASIFAASGLHLGDELMAAAPSNPRGHFEDLAFYDLHQRILAANGLSMEGFTCQEVIDVPDSARRKAADLVRRRREGGRPWGWKDPRTVLFLDFWAELLPEARWLFVVRRPEEVIDSLFRRGDTAFVENPRHAVDVWVAYNRRILDFVRRHAERSVVVDLPRVVADPAGVVAAVATVAGLDLPAPASPYEPGLLVGEHAMHRRALVRALRPEADDLHGELLRLAGDARAHADHRPPDRPAALAEAALVEWAAACRASAERGHLAGRELEARRAAEAIAGALEAERAERRLATDRASELAAAAAARDEDLAAERAAGRASERRCIELAAEITRLGEARDTLAGACDALAAESAAMKAALEAERRATAESRAELERQLAAERARAENERVGRVEALARLEAERAGRDEEHARLEAALAEAESRGARAARDAESLAGERDELVAQLEAERSLHESLRQDMTGRIEAAIAARRR